MSLTPPAAWQLQTSRAVLRFWPLPSRHVLAGASLATQGYFCSAGAVVVFDVTTSSPGKFVKTFTDNSASGCGSLLHRPDYPVWGKDGRLYINGFKAVRNVSSCPVHCTMRLHVLCMPAPTAQRGVMVAVLNRAGNSKQGKQCHAHHTYLKA